MAKGKEFKSLGRFGAQKARKIIEDGMKLYRKPKGKTNAKKK
jgi:hypothetical protein